MKRQIGVLAIMTAVLMLLFACGAASSVSEKPKHTLTYLGGEGKTIEPYAGDPHTLVCVYTEYTNDSGETVLPADYVNVKAFQHGVEIPIMVFIGTKIDDYIQCDTAVQSGVTAKVIWTFQPTDESEITVELSTGDKHILDGTVVDTAALFVSEMPTKLQYDRMWVYSAHGETEDATVIKSIVDAVNALKIGEPTEIFVTDYTDILSFTFADGGMLRLEFEENNWVKDQNERYHVEGLGTLRGLLDDLLPEE